MGAWARGVASFPDHICFSFFNNKRGARLISNEPRPRTFHLRRGPIRACAGSYEALRVAGSHRVGRLAFGRPYDSAPLRERCEGFSMSFWDRDVLPLPRATRTTSSSSSHRRRRQPRDVRRDHSRWHQSQGQDDGDAGGDRCWLIRMSCISCVPLPCALSWAFDLEQRWSYTIAIVTIPPPSSPLTREEEGDIHHIKAYHSLYERCTHVSSEID